MNNYILGVGCFVADTPFQVNRGTFGDVCGLIIKYNTENGKIVALEPEFFTAEQLGGLKIKDFWRFFFCVIKRLIYHEYVLNVYM